MSLLHPHPPPFFSYFVDLYFEFFFNDPFIFRLNSRMSAITTLNATAESAR
jgi:hypothetical protein